jgi:hypothetical protein
VYKLYIATFTYNIFHFLVYFILKLSDLFALTVQCFNNRSPKIAYSVINVIQIINQTNINTPTYMKVAMDTTTNAKFSPCEQSMEHSPDSFMARDIKSCYFLRRKGSSVKRDEEN